MYLVGWMKGCHVLRSHPQVYHERVSRPQVYLVAGHELKAIPYRGGPGWLGEEGGVPRTFPMHPKGSGIAAAVAREGTVREPPFCVSYERGDPVGFTTVLNPPFCFL